MGVNRDKPDLWKDDIIKSVDLYNSWFMKFAPQAFRETRIEATKSVLAALAATNNLRDVTPETLRDHPAVLSTLRMSTCPPLARDRLVGLAGVSKSLVYTMEDDKRVPPTLNMAALMEQLTKIGVVVERLADPDIFIWLGKANEPTDAEVFRASTIVADRLCGARANPIIRNAQESRQLKEIAAWLDARNYKLVPPGASIKFSDMTPGTYAFRLNVVVTQGEGGATVNISIDAVVMRKTAKPQEFPLFIEAKSAGDFTNVNKRRKEEAQKAAQLSKMYGSQMQFILFLCGYFDSGYLGYEAAESIDWVWEHRIDDLALFGL